MSEALKSLNNIRTLRVQAREVTLETLEEMLEKLSVVVEERREEESSLRKEQEEKEAKLAAFRQKLLDEGIDPTELLSSLKGQATKTKSVRAPRPAKYKYIDEDGTEKKAGPARAVRRKSSLRRWKKAKSWKTSPSKRQGDNNIALFFICSATSSSPLQIRLHTSFYQGCDKYRLCRSSAIPAVKTLYR